jgi:tetratricopeptide (TPR) repeat protein
MANDLSQLQSSARDVARWQKAQQQIVGGRPAAALPIYQELVKQFPNIEQLWFELGLAAMAELEFKRATDAFERAQQLAATDAEFQVLLGQQYHRLRSADRARACFEKAAQVSPQSIHAQLSLAAWYERERRLEDALRCVDASLAAHPGESQALCIKALLLHRCGRDTDAEPILRDIVQSDSRNPNVRVSSRHLLGTVLDKLGQYEEALRWISESKAILKATANVAKMERDYDQADRFRRELLAQLNPEMIRRWKTEPSTPTLTNQLILLGGHPRSGTTLLEQILGAHPAVVAFDEPEAFVQEIWQTLAPLTAPRALGATELDKLGPAQRTWMRQRYLKSLYRELEHEVSGRVLLDKNPSPTAALHLGLRVFPELKAIIALRDPRDVVVSCYFQNLMLTPANANFLSLERTAKHYADLMDVWLRMRELGGFDWVESRYEDLVANPELEGRKVTEFCGLSWDPNQASHYLSARKKVLFAPTFSDVAQPIHHRAVGRWQHYAEALKGIQPVLAPYCKAFGYQTE